MMNDVLKHIDAGLYKIRGFMHPSDAVAFGALLDNQEHWNTGGALAEIGVFYGRSFSLLALSAKATNSLAVGLDLFDIDGQRTYVDAVLRRLRTMTHDATLVSGPSEAVTAASFIERFGLARFWHIDGGHERHHLINDFTLARATMTREGIIIFDDFFNPQYPDLTTAIIDVLRGAGDDELIRSDRDLVPFAITRSKLYTCEAPYAARYRDAIADHARGLGLRQDTFTMLGFPVLHISQPLAHRAIYEGLARFGMGGLARAILPDTQPKFARQ